MCVFVFVCFCSTETPSRYSVDETLFYYVQGGHGGSAITTGQYQYHYMYTDIVTNELHVTTAPPCGVIGEPELHRDKCLM